MEFLALDHTPDDFQQPLTLDQIRAVTSRAFGARAHIEAIRELSGGEYNTIYRLALAGGDPVILRVAPSPARWAPWHEELLMRREQTVQPYFAALGPLLPRTLLVDFTRDLLDRDYLFQTCMPGEQWKTIAHRLTPEDGAVLWRELAHITQRIHSVTGEAFGHPYPGRCFPTWGFTILDWLERALRDIERFQLESAGTRAILAHARARMRLLDGITSPQLLHGDLWPFNVLVASSETGWHITAVLDYDRAAWGDPFADWTFHLLPRRATPAVRALFWEEYGKPEETPGARFRELIYDGMHVSNVLVEGGRRRDADLVAKARAGLARVVAGLGELRMR